MGKVHGGLARAGKVKSHTPHVEPQEKKKALTGRAKRRMQYNKVNIIASCIQRSCRSASVVLFLC